MTAEEIEAGLADIPGWALVEGKLHREYKFSNFAKAWEFMGKVAALAEEADHHPDWSNSYNKVCIDLWTHCLGGLSQKDLSLAKAIGDLE